MPDIPADVGTLSFSDIIDAVNPLQHIPVLSGIYRAVTGSSISTGAQLAGDTLYGGVAGFVSSLANTVVKQVSGEDITGHLVASLTGNSTTGVTPTLLIPDTGTAVLAAMPADMPTPLSIQRAAIQYQRAQALDALRWA